eukprot:365940-Chlamydomonas_euryale.AAC.16
MSSDMPSDPRRLMLSGPANGMLPAPPRSETAPPSACGPSSALRNTWPVGISGTVTDRLFLCRSAAAPSPAPPPPPCACTRAGPGFKQLG